jgi:hypothetical protein
MHITAEIQLIGAGKPDFDMVELGSSERIRGGHKKQKVRISGTCTLVFETALLNCNKIEHISNFF